MSKRLVAVSGAVLAAVAFAGSATAYADEPNNNQQPQPAEVVAAVTPVPAEHQATPDLQAQQAPQAVDPDMQSQQEAMQDAQAEQQRQQAEAQADQAAGAAGAAGAGASSASMAAMGPQIGMSMAMMAPMVGMMGLPLVTPLLTSGLTGLATSGANNGANAAADAGSAAATDALNLGAPDVGSAAATDAFNLFDPAAATDTFSLAGADVPLGDIPLDVDISDFLAGTADLPAELANLGADVGTQVAPDAVEAGVCLGLSIIGACG
ncbi:MAG: hypothetical protein WBA50_10250 [Mycobacterium sp.]